MLIAGLVKLTNSKEGSLRLFEGERADTFNSYQLWEVAIWEPRVTGEVVERIIPGGAAAQLDVLGRVAVQKLHRGIEAQRLFDRCIDELAGLVDALALTLVE